MHTFQITEDQPPWLPRHCAARKARLETRRGRRRLRGPGSGPALSAGNKGPEGKIGERTGNRSFGRHYSCPPIE